MGDGGFRLVSSTEPKAIETAEAVARRWEGEVLPDDRLREAQRPWIGPGYRAVAHRYLRGELPDGWEPHADVAARMGAAVSDALAAATGAPVVVVTHGLILSIHLGDRLGADFDRESFWSRLAFPDAWALDADDTLHRSLPAPITLASAVVGRLLVDRVLERLEVLAALAELSHHHHGEERDGDDQERDPVPRR